MKKSHSVDLLAAVILLFLFLMTGACSLALGVRTWRGIESQMEQNFDKQTPLSYLAGKARQSENLYADAFSDGTPALALTSTWAGERYITRLYCHDNMLYELFSPENVRLTPADGTPLIALQDMTLTADGGLLRVSCTAQDGTKSELLLAVSGEGAHA